MENWLFRELVVNLMCLSISTRPDTSNVVRAVARYCCMPKDVHLKTALRILACIKETIDDGIIFQRGSLTS